MSKVDPLVNFAQIIYFGNPLHGTVSNGILDDPINGQKAYPNPINSDVRLFMRDDAVPLPVDQSAIGLRHYALKSGGMLAGTMMADDFIYNDGVDTWSFSIASISLSGTTVTVVLNKRLFGKLSIPPLAPVAPIQYTLQFDDDVDVNTYEFVNAHPNGTKALYKIGGAKVAFIEFDLVGVPSIQISKNVAETKTIVGSHSEGVSYGKSFNITLAASGDLNVGEPTVWNQTAGPTTNTASFNLVDLGSYDEINSDITITNILWAHYSNSGALRYLEIKVNSVVRNLINRSDPILPADLTATVEEYDVATPGGDILVWRANEYNRTGANVTGASASTTEEEILSIIVELGGADIWNGKHHYANNSVTTPQVDYYQPTFIQSPAGDGSQWLNIEKYPVTAPTINTTTSHETMDDEIDSQSTSRQLMAAVHEKFKGNLQTGTAPNLNNILYDGTLRIRTSVKNNNISTLDYFQRTGSQLLKRMAVITPSAALSGVLSPASDNYAYQPFTGEVIRESPQLTVFV